MMEPAVLGKPVLTGPYTRNFRPDMALLQAAGAVFVVRDRAQLAGEVDRLLSHHGLAERMGKAARGVVTASRGATERTLQRLSPMFSSG